VGQELERYAYDAAGNMTQMPHLPRMDWDFKDQLHATRRQVVNTGLGETTYYVYDSSGQRVRKITERASGSRKDERDYLGGYELYRRYDSVGTAAMERETLHVMDDKRRIALVETKTIHESSRTAEPKPHIRLQFSNHLGSAVLELDEEASIITYEEFYPYGSTSFEATQASAEVSRKRYRYTGKERDEETGFGYHGARYYAPWLGRWTAADPTGIGDGPNVYRYVGCNPIRLVDVKGTNGQAPAVLQPTATPPPYQAQTVPPAYASQASQVGTDTGAVALAAAKVAEKSPQVQALEKRVLKKLKDEFKLDFKADPVGTVVGVGLPVLGLAAPVVALAVTNAKLDLPIVGQKSGRTLVAPPLSAGLGAVTGALTNDRLKLGVGYSEDPKGKPTYSASVELQGKDKEKVKLDASFGAHPGFKASADVPLHVSGVEVHVVGLVSIPTGPGVAPGSPFQPNLTLANPFLAGGALVTSPSTGVFVGAGVVIPFGGSKKTEHKKTE
jgi:RHS repeat-associated protein